MGKAAPTLSHPRQTHEQGRHHVNSHRTPSNRGQGTVGRGQSPQTNDDSGVEEYRDSEDYDEEDDGTDCASILAEAPKPDLRGIMASIQALAYGRPQTGGPRREQRQRQALARTYPLGATPPTRPLPEDLGRQTQQAAPDTLAALGGLG